LELDYVDFADWVRKENQKEGRHRNYWSKKLSGNLKRLNLPILKERELVQGAAVSQMIAFLDKDVHEKIKLFSREADVTDFMFFLSIFYIVLHKITGDQDIIVGTDAIGRNSKALEGIVGTFVNILPLRADIDRESNYSAFLRRVKECVLEAFEHQEYPYDQIVSMVGPEIKQLFDVHFSFANTFDSNEELKELEFKSLVFEEGPVSEYEHTDLIASRRPEYDIEVVVGEKEGRFQLWFLYNNSLYDAETIRILMDTYIGILKTVMGNKKIDIDKIDAERAMSIQ
jgi:non-ribosomal peptide synthetase component F